MTSCDEVDNLPTIKFLLKGKNGDDYWTEWLPEDYLVEVGDYEECQVCLYANDNDDKFILGNSFMRGYYAQFDKDNL